MATNIEQIFRSFVVNKFKEIQEEGKLNSENSESSQNGEETEKAEVPSESAVCLQSEGSSQIKEDEPVKPEPEKPAISALETDSASKETKSADVTSDDEGKRDSSKKKSKKHKKHKSKKKKKKKKKEKHEKRSKSVSSVEDQENGNSESMTVWKPAFTSPPQEKGNIDTLSSKGESTNTECINVAEQPSVSIQKENMKSGKDQPSLLQLDVDSGFFGPKCPNEVTTNVPNADIGEQCGKSTSIGSHSSISTMHTEQSLETTKARDGELSLANPLQSSSIEEINLSQDVHKKNDCLPPDNKSLSKVPSKPEVAKTLQKQKEKSRSKTKSPSRPRSRSKSSNKLPKSFQSRSKSPKRKRRSRSSSRNQRKRSRSGSFGQKRRSRSKSPIRRRRSRSRTPSRYSKSPIRSWWSKSIRNRQRSVSLVRRRRSRTRSLARRRKSRSAEKRYYSRTRSRSGNRVQKSRRSKSASARRTRSKSLRRRRSRSGSESKRKHSKSVSPEKKVQLDHTCVEETIQVRLASQEEEAFQVLLASQEEEAFQVSLASQKEEAFQVSLASQEEEAFQVSLASQEEEAFQVSLASQEEEAFQVSLASQEEEAFQVSLTCQKEKAFQVSLACQEEEVALASVKKQRSRSGSAKRQSSRSNSANKRTTMSISSSQKMLSKSPSTKKTSQSEVGNMSQSGAVDPAQKSESPEAKRRSDLLADDFKMSTKENLSSSMEVEAKNISNEIKAPVLASKLGDKSEIVCMEETNNKIVDPPKKSDPETDSLSNSAIVRNVSESSSPHPKLFCNVSSENPASPDPHVEPPKPTEQISPNSTQTNIVEIPTSSATSGEGSVSRILTNTICQSSCEVSSATEIPCNLTSKPDLVTMNCESRTLISGTTDLKIEKPKSPGVSDIYDLPTSDLHKKSDVTLQLENTFKKSVLGANSKLGDTTNLLSEKETAQSSNLKLFDSSKYRMNEGETNETLSHSTCSHNKKPAECLSSITLPTNPDLHGNENTDKLDTVYAPLHGSELNNQFISDAEVKPSLSQKTSSTSLEQTYESETLKGTLPEEVCFKSASQEDASADHQAEDSASNLSLTSTNDAVFQNCEVASQTTLDAKLHSEQADHEPKAIVPVFTKESSFAGMSIENIPGSSEPTNNADKSESSISVLSERVHEKESLEFQLPKICETSSNAQTFVTLQDSTPDEISCNSSTAPLPRNVVSDQMHAISSEKNNECIYTDSNLPYDKKQKCNDILEKIEQSCPKATCESFILKDSKTIEDTVSTNVNEADGTGALLSTKSFNGKKSQSPEVVLKPILSKKSEGMYTDKSKNSLSSEVILQEGPYKHDATSNMVMEQRKANADHNQNSFLGDDKSLDLKSSVSTKTLEDKPIYLSSNSQCGTEILSQEHLNQQMVASSSNQKTLIDPCSIKSDAKSKVGASTDCTKNAEPIIHGKLIVKVGAEPYPQPEEKIEKLSSVSETLSVLEHSQPPKTQSGSTSFIYEMPKPKLMAPLQFKFSKTFKTLPSSQICNTSDESSDKESSKVSSSPSAALASAQASGPSHQKQLGTSLPSRLLQSDSLVNIEQDGKSVMEPDVIQTDDSQSNVQSGTVKPAFPHLSTTLSKLGVKQRQYRSRSVAQDSRSPSQDRRHASRSRSKSAARKRRSRSKSVSRKKRSQSSSRKKSSHSKSVKRKQSRSKSRGRKRRSQSKSKSKKSSGKRKRSQSKSSERKKSVGRHRDSRSKSKTRRKQAQSKSPSVNRRSRSKSAARKGSHSKAGRNASRSKSLSSRSRSRSVSKSRKPLHVKTSRRKHSRSSSKSASPRRRSLSRNKGRSGSKSPAQRRRSWSRSRRRPRSRSRGRWQRSRSLSSSRKRSRSSSLSNKKRGSISKSPVRRRRSRSHGKPKEKSPVSKRKSVSPLPQKKTTQLKASAFKHSIGLKSLIQKQLSQAKSQGTGAKSSNKDQIPLSTIAARAQLPAANFSARAQSSAPTLATVDHLPVPNLAEVPLPTETGNVQVPMATVPSADQVSMTSIAGEASMPVPDLTTASPWHVHDMSGGAQWPVPDIAAGTQWSMSDLSAGAQWPMADLTAGSHWPMHDIGVGTQWPVPDLAAGTQWAMPDVATGAQWTVPGLTASTQWTVPDLTAGSQWAMTNMAPGTQWALPDLAAAAQWTVPDITSGTHMQSADLAPEAQVPGSDLSTEAQVPGSDLAAEAQVPGSDLAAEAQVPGSDLVSEAQVPVPDHIPDTCDNDHHSEGHNLMPDVAAEALVPVASATLVPDVAAGIPLPDVTAAAQCPVPDVAATTLLPMPDVATAAQGLMSSYASTPVLGSVFEDPSKESVYSDLSCAREEPCVIESIENLKSEDHTLLSNLSSENATVPEISSSLSQEQRSVTSKCELLSEITDNPTSIDTCLEQSRSDVTILYESSTDCNNQLPTPIASSNIDIPVLHEPCRLPVEPDTSPNETALIEPYHSPDHNLLIEPYSSPDRSIVVAKCSDSSHPLLSEPVSDHSVLINPCSSDDHAIAEIGPSLDQPNQLVINIFEKQNSNDYSTAQTCPEPVECYDSPKQEVQPSPNSQTSEKCHSGSDVPQLVEPYASPEPPQLVEPYSSPVHPQLVEPYSSPACPQLVEPYASPEHPQLVEQYGSPESQELTEMCAMPESPQVFQPNILSDQSELHAVTELPRLGQPCMPQELSQNQENASSDLPQLVQSSPSPELLMESCSDPDNLPAAQSNASSGSSQLVEQFDCTEELQLDQKCTSPSSNQESRKLVEPYSSPDHCQEDMFTSNPCVSVNLDSPCPSNTSDSLNQMLSSLPNSRFEEPVLGENDTNTAKPLQEECIRSLVRRHSCEDKPECDRAVSEEHNDPVNQSTSKNIFDCAHEPTKDSSYDSSQHLVPKVDDEIFVHFEQDKIVEEEVYVEDLAMHGPPQEASTEDILACASVSHLDEDCTDSIHSAESMHMSDQALGAQTVSNSSQLLKDAYLGLPIVEDTGGSSNSPLGISESSSIALHERSMSSPDVSSPKQSICGLDTALENVTVPTLEQEDALNMQNLSDTTDQCLIEKTTSSLELDPPDRLSALDESSNDNPYSDAETFVQQQECEKKYDCHLLNETSCSPKQPIEEQPSVCVEQIQQAAVSESISASTVHSQDGQILDESKMNISPGPVTNLDEEMSSHSCTEEKKEQSYNDSLALPLPGETVHQAPDPPLISQDKLPSSVKESLSIEPEIPIVEDSGGHLQINQCKISPPDLLPFDSDQPTHTCTNLESSEPVLFNFQPPPELLPYDSEQPTDAFRNMSDFSNEQDASVFHTPPELLPYDSDQTTVLFKTRSEYDEDSTSTNKSNDQSEQSLLSTNKDKTVNQVNLETTFDLLPDDGKERVEKSTSLLEEKNEDKVEANIITLSLVDKFVVNDVSMSMHKTAEEELVVSEMLDSHSESILPVDCLQDLPPLESVSDKTIHIPQQTVLPDVADAPLTQNQHSVDKLELVSDTFVDSQASTTDSEEKIEENVSCTVESCSGDAELQNVSEVEKSAMLESTVSNIRSPSSEETPQVQPKQTSLQSDSRTSRSPSKDRKESRSKSTTRKPSPSKSPIKKSRSKSRPPSKSSAQRKRSRSGSRHRGSPPRKRRSRTPSVSRKRSSRSKSTTRRRLSPLSHSHSVARKRRSRSPSTGYRRRSRTRSPIRQRRSRSPSVRRRRRSRSFSVTRRRRSRSSSTIRRRRSRSVSPVRRRRSPSPLISRWRQSSSLNRRRRSRSPSSGRRRRSRSFSRRKRSRSTSTSRKRRSPSAHRRRRSQSSSATRRKRSPSTQKVRSPSKSPTLKKRSRSKSLIGKRRSRSLSARKRHSRTPSVVCKRKSESKSPAPKSPKNKPRAQSKSDRSRSRSPSDATRKRKTRSRSASKDKLNDKRRKRSNSKEHYSSKPRRKSRTPPRRKKSRSPGRRLSPCRSPVRRRRSRSPVRRKSFSRSPVRRKRSRSRDQSLDSARSPKRLTDLDKAQLLEIAKANAAAMCAKAGVPLPPSLKPVISPAAPTDDKNPHRNYGVTIQELTEKCKQIAQSKEDDEVVNKPHNSDDDEDDKPFYNHPFKVGEHKPISFSLLNPNLKPALKTPVTLTKEFPVSSGSQHRKKESDKVYGEWVPVDKKSEETKDDVFTHTGPSQPVDITSAMNERAIAQTRLTGNPFDLEALFMLNRAQEQIDAWAQSTSLPGQFTGSTGAQVLSADEISNSGPQAWLKKDQFLRAAPVSGGRGALLMRKMGWKEGEGLGRNNEGNVDPIVLDFKTDRKGLVADGEKASNKLVLPAMKDLSGKHPISALMELCNKKKWSPPDFLLVDDTGPDHRKRFLFKVSVNGVTCQPSQASVTKKLAKATAAAAALQALGALPKDTMTSTSNFCSASSANTPP
ncbi:protein SON [Gastrophryne carolinensis]